ncbi:ABC transporter permease [Chitinophaga sp. Cy-1792]|uniref:ABC transporter permease n=1 Tax=Chitinophaga sp. Cy-1792 TaxID=2608339 RepID=UPI00141E18F8|nr:FtsX-like permease family protein [Chitinophaga sp. Cy-1792]NIG57051.1 ABC transporter permease [Chitinophaga sp. Cy-1792]
MRLPSFIARRIAFNKSSSFSGFIIKIAIAATAVSVAVMILAIGLVNGFQEVIQGKIFDFWGNILINQYQPNAGPLTQEKPFDYDSTLVRNIRQLPEVKSINSYATKSAIVKADKEIDGVIFKGVGKDYNWESLKRFIVAGNILQYNDSTFAPGVILSSSIANDLNLKVNDKVIIYFIQGGGQSPRARKLTVTGIYKTAIEDYDKTYILGDINLIRRLNDWDPQQIGGYEIAVKDYHQMDSTAKYIDENMLSGDLFTRTIADIYPNIFDWLKLQNKNKYIILIIMTIVAAINLVTALLILILERTNMVGILKALGMRNWSIQKIFTWHAAYIITIGIAIGDFVGLSLAWLQQTYGLFKLPEDTYYMPVAAVSLYWYEVVAINAGTLLICICILLLPSLIIRKITPVKAIQFK